MQQRSSAFTRAIGGIAFAAGIIAAYFLAPIIHAASAAWVIDFSYRHYAPEIAEWSATGWLVTLAIAVFFGTKGIVAAILSMIALSLANRAFED